MDRTGYKDYQLTIDKIYEYGLYAAPDRKLIYAPPGIPKVEYTYTEFARRVNRLGEALEKLGRVRHSLNRHPEREHLF